MISDAWRRLLIGIINSEIEKERESSDDDDDGEHLFMFNHSGTFAMNMSRKCEVSSRRQLISHGTNFPFLRYTLHLFQMESFQSEFTHAMNR